MKLSHRSLITLTFIILASLISCSDDNQSQEMFTDNFDRREMLEDWADNIIIPALEAYITSLENLRSSKDEFFATSNPDNLESFRSSYINAYKAWQRVSFFDIGKFEEIGLRNYTNIYPTDTASIRENIENQNYDLSLPSNFDTQGFPALDYLLFGLSDNYPELINTLIDENYSKYLDDLTSRLYDLSSEVLSDWNNGYRDSFINNDGSSATASVDKMVNDFLFYYEKFLRAGKIGIPAGIFSGNSIANSVEAPYSNIYSKTLFFEAFESVQDFFVGNSFDRTGQVVSLESYLNYIQEQNQTEDIAGQIKDQWASAESKANELSDSFKDQVLTDNNKMLEAYDELQKAVVLLKVDMMQALNIQVDFVDADGD